MLGVVGSIIHFSIEWQYNSSITLKIGRWNSPLQSRVIVPNMSIVRYSTPWVNAFKVKYRTVSPIKPSGTKWWLEGFRWPSSIVDECLRVRFRFHLHWLFGYSINKFWLHVTFFCLTWSRNQMMTYSCISIFTGTFF